ncbi:MAG: Gfo/Idh/MocA family protein [Gemmatimonadaceae bacterium]
MEPPFRVGLIGFGLAGASFHAPFIAATPELELTVIATGNPERQRDAARAHPRAAIVTSTDDLWARAGELDLVVIASPNRTHAPLALEAIAHDLNVVVDKPLTRTVDEARRVIDAAADRGVMVTVFQNRRWDGDFLTVQSILANGDIGRPYRFESRFDRWRPTPKGGWRERSDPEEAGGLLYDLGSHLIDQALVLFGPPTHVYAELDRRRPGMEVDDDVFVALTHANGVRSHLFMSAVVAISGPRFRLLGSRAAYVKWGLDVQESKLRRGQLPGSTEFLDEPQDEPGKIGAEDDVRSVPTIPGDYRRFYVGVRDALRGAAPPVDPAHAIATLAVIDAAGRSAAEARVMRLDEGHARGQ